MKTELKILHLEDTPADAELVERELKKGNIQFETLVVGTRTAFEKALKEFVPDIIIADHSLPSFDSLDAIRIMKQKGIKIPIILVTATVSDEYAVEIMKAGADDYILKDRLHRLPQAVLNSMEKYSLERAKEAVIDELINSQLHLKEAQAVAKLGSWETDFQTFNVKWSDETHRIFETDPGTFQATHEAFLHFTHPDDRAKVNAALEKSLNSQTDTSIEHRIISKNGILKHVIENWRIFQDDNCHPVRAVGTCQDITERKKTAQIIYDSEEKYYSLFENSLDAILLTVTDGKILAANPAACTMFGMSEEEICEAGRFGLVDTTDLRLAAALEERQRTGKVKAEVTAIRKKGERFPGEFTSVVYKNANGEERTSLIVRDITERKHAEQLLKESEQFNKGILASLSSHIAVIDHKGNIITVNKAWDDFAKTNGVDSLVGVSTGSNYIEVCQRSMAAGDILAGQTLEGIQSVFNKEVKTFELEYPCHSSTEQRWFNLSVMNFGEDDSKIVISHQNITDRKTAENKLSNTSVELQKTLSEHTKILDSSLDVICTINANGEFVNVSAASQQVWGYPPEELTGTKFINLVYEQDIDNTSKAAKKIVSGTQMPVFENRYVHKSGRVVPMLWSVNWDEKLGLMYCTAKDVTEKKKLEKAVKTERDQFFEMFSKAPSAIGMLKGANHVFEMANPLYLKLTGKKDIIGKTVAEVLPEVIEQGFVSMLDHVYQTGESYTDTEELVKVDTEGNGEFTDFYIDFVYQAYRNGEGNIEGVFFFINDVTEQIVSKKKIEKSEKQYRQIVETAQEGIWKIDEFNKTTFVNQKLCEILEYTKDEMLGKEIYNFMDEEGKQLAEKLIQVRQSGEAGHHDFKFISKSGKEIWTSVSANPIIDDEGKYMGALAMLSDINDRVKAEIENKFQANLLNIIGQAAIATDMLGTVSYWNKAAEQIYGWSQEDAIGKNILHLMTSHETKEQALEIMDDLKNGRSWSGEFKVQRKDGTSFPAIVANSPIYDENNKLSGIIGISSDITEKKKLEALLDKSNRLARIGSWEIDVDKGTVFWSDITKEIREADPDYIPDLSTGIGFFTEGMNKKIISQRVQQCIDNGVPWDEELQITTFKGNLKWVRTIGEAEFVHGKCSKVYGSLQDVTERKIVQEKLEQQNLELKKTNAELDRFVYSTSHDLRAPITSLQGLINIMDESLPEAELDQKGLIGMMKQSIIKLDSFIGDIISYSRNSRTETEKDEINFEALINESLETLKYMEGEPACEIKMEVVQMGKFISDKRRISVIINNLIGNAIKYQDKTKPDPYVSVSVHTDESKAIITVEDNGIGIADDKQERIFEMFYRATKLSTGSGLGMYIVKETLEKLNATITVKSKLDSGTTFTVTIPNLIVIK